MTTNDETAEIAEPWLVELLVHSDPGPLVRKHLSLAKVLALSRACKSLHKLMLDETTRARNVWVSAKAAAAAEAEAKENVMVAEGRVSSICAGMACISGYLSMLVYLHENDCQWDKRLTYLTAENGHLDCLKYAHENGCPWDEDTCRSAARKGKLVCLQYAHESGCPWDKRTCRYAAKHGHLDCLQYLREKNCPGWEKYM